MKIAVVRNRENQGVLSKINQPSPEKYGKKSVQAVIDALRAGGHTVKVLEGDMTLLPQLAEFMPPEPETGRPTGLVFNMAYGIQGEGRYEHVPALLEMAGIPYTGPGPRSHSLALDKIITKLLMQQVGVPTPKFRLLSNPDDPVDGLTFPLVIKPRYESTSYGLELAHDLATVKRAVEFIVTTYHQDAFAEEYIHGREVAVALLGNNPVEVLPVVELDFGQRQYKIMTHSDKFHKTADEPQKSCPAELPPGLKEKLGQMALAVFRACHCRDYARLDIRLDQDNRPFALEINSMASLGQGGEYVLAAKTAGYGFTDLVCRIVDVAHQRYFGEPAPRDLSSPLPDNPPASE